MKPLGKFEAKNLIDSFADIIYITDLEGAIVAYNEKNWNEFATENGTPELADPALVIGRSLYDFITDEETRNIYKKFAESLIKQIRDSVIFFYRCDAPEVKREMRMAITPVMLDGKPAALIYHSITLNEELRPPMNILKPRKPETDSPDMTMLGICSYCKNVRIDPDSLIGVSVTAEVFGQAMSTAGAAYSKTGIWVTPERYYRLGGSERVMLSHGICPTCYMDIVYPMISQLKRQS